MQKDDNVLPNRPSLAFIRDIEDIIQKKTGELGIINLDQEKGLVLITCADGEIRDDVDRIMRLNIRPPWKWQYKDITVTPTKDLIEKPDLINYPPHYNSHPSGVECIEITRHMNFNCGTVVKYMWRSGLKTAIHDDALKAALDDVSKAVWHAIDEARRLRKLCEEKGIDVSDIRPV